MNLEMKTLKYLQILTLSRYQPAPMPVLSCSIRSLVIGPTQLDLKRKVSEDPESNIALAVLVRWTLPELPDLPNNVMKTLAFVPAPRRSPVTVTTSYSEDNQIEIIHYLIPLSVLKFECSVTNYKQKPVYI